MKKVAVSFKKMHKKGGTKMDLFFSQNLTKYLW